MLVATQKENTYARVLQHASGDKRFKILEAHMKKFQFRHDALIEILHKAQELFGYLAWRHFIISSRSNRRASITAWSAWGRPVT